MWPKNVSQWGKKIQWQFVPLSTSNFSPYPAMALLCPEKRSTESFSISGKFSIFSHRKAFDQRPSCSWYSAERKVIRIVKYENGLKNILEIENRKMQEIEKCWSLIYKEKRKTEKLCKIFTQKIFLSFVFFVSEREVWYFYVELSNTLDKWRDNKNNKEEKH